MCAVPNTAVFCSSLTSRFPGILLTFIIIIIIIIIMDNFSLNKTTPLRGMKIFVGFPFSYMVSF